MNNSNTGHGHVFPRPDGMRARCGGPGICKACALDAQRKVTGEPKTVPASMTLDEWFAEAKRIGLTADTLAAQLSKRPEFADCLPAAQPAQAPDFKNPPASGNASNDKDLSPESGAQPASGAPAQGEREAWHQLFDRVALALNCLPSSFVDGNTHVLRTAEKARAALAAPPSAAPEPVAGWKFEPNGDVIAVTAPDGVRWYVIKDEARRKDAMGAFFHELCAALAAPSTKVSP